MRYIVDVIFSDWLYMTLIILVVMFTCIGFAFKNPFQNLYLNRAYKVTLYLIAFTSMMSMTFLYFGLSKGFSKIIIGKNILVLQENYERGGEGPSEYVTRMHILNKKDGTEIDRLYIGAYAKVVDVKGDSVAYISDNGVYVINGKTGEEYFSIDEDNWSSVNPDLSVGINRVDDNQNRDDRIKPMIDIDCKNGKHYSMDPFTKTFSDPNAESQYLPKFSKRTFDLYYIKGKQSYRYYLQTRPTSNYQVHTIVATGEGEKLFTGTCKDEFIQPYLMCIDTIQRFFVFGHFTTTDRKDFILEARDFSFKQLWKYTTDQLEVKDRYNKYECNVWEYENGILYFNAGGFVIAMDPAKNKIIWKERH